MNFYTCTEFIVAIYININSILACYKHRLKILDRHTKSTLFHIQNVTQEDGCHSDKGAYPREDLRSAVRSILNGEITVNDAHTKFNIPIRTIQDHVKYVFPIFSSHTHTFGINHIFRVVCYSMCKIVWGIYRGMHSSPLCIWESTIPPVYIKETGMHCSSMRTLRSSCFLNRPCGQISSHALVKALPFHHFVCAR